MLLVAVAVEHHAHGKTGAILPLLQGAEAGRQPLRQHRHHAVGEIDGVAALIGSTVQRRTRRDVVADIGNRHDGDVTARVARIVIRACPHRIVVIACIFGVDRDKRDVTQIGAPLRAGRLGTLGLRNRVCRKFGRNAVGVNGNQADRLGRIHAAQPLHNAGARGTIGAAGQRFGQHQFVRFGAVLVARIDHEFQPAFAIDRRDQAFAFAVMKHAQNLVRGCAQPLDDAGFITVSGFTDAGEDAVAVARRIALAPRQHDNLRRFFIALPPLRAGQKLAIVIAATDFQHQHLGQGTRLGEAAFAAAGDGAFGFQLFQNALQRDAVIADNAQRACQIALGGVRIAGKRIEHAFPAERGLRFPVAFFVQDLSLPPPRLRAYQF